MARGRIARLALAALALGACGGGATSPDADAGGDAPDGDASDVPTGDVAADGTGAFIVTATLSLTPFPDQGGSLDGFPKTHTFTMFVDGQALRMVAGAQGGGTAIALTRDAAGTFSAKNVSVRTMYRGPCDNVGVTYDVLSFSIEGGRLSGTGRGQAVVFMGDYGRIANANATLTGVPDAELPTIVPSESTIEPMGSATFAASEPLAESAASLIGADGDVFALGAQISEGPPSFTTGFVRSPLMLNWGSTYEITTEALVDFAGHVGDRAARPKVTTPPAPPLAAAESLTIVDGYTTGFGVNPARAVARRLPVQPGDTVVRFSARLVTTQNREAEFRGEVRVGVPGREVTVATIPRAKELVEVTVANAPSRYEGPATTIEVPLPLGTNPEVSFQVAALPPTCSAQPPGVAVIIDDLRVE